MAAHHWKVLSGCQRSSRSATPHLILEGRALVSRGSGQPEHRGTSPAQHVRSVPSWRCRQRLLEFQTRSASPLVSLTSLKNVCGSPLVSEHYLNMTLLWSYRVGSVVFARREPWPSRLRCPLCHVGPFSGAWQWRPCCHKNRYPHPQKAGLPSDNSLSPFIPVFRPVPPRCRGGVRNRSGIVHTLPVVPGPGDP